MIVLDVSGSMWGQIEGKSKIEIARETLSGLLDGFSDSQSVGLIAYGHRRKGDCNDIETLIPLSKLDRAFFKKTLNGLTPIGKTPLSASVLHAAEELKYTENKATVVLVTDGLETCEMDPCKLGESLASKGLDFTAHVICFDVAKMDQESLKCLAEKTGGKYLTANNALELTKAMEVAVEKSIVTPELVKISSIKIEAELIAPDEAIIGTLVTIDFKTEEALSGKVYLYRVGSDISITSDEVRIDEKLGGYKSSTLRMPANAGEYEIRWIKGFSTQAE